MFKRLGVGAALALALLCAGHPAEAGYCNAAIPCTTALSAPGAIGAGTPSTLAGTTLTLTPAGNAKAIDASSGYSLTGSDASAGINLTGTWNTSGAPTALLVGITDTASDAAASRLATFSAGGNNLFGIGTDLTASTIFFPGVNSSTNTSTLNALNLSESFNPAGASLSIINGILNQPNISGSSLTIGNYFGESVLLRTGAGFTGTVTKAENFRSQTPTNGGSNPMTTFIGFNQDAITNGTGNTTGTITNTAINITAPTAVAASGGTMNHTGVAIGMASGTNAGTATNTGLSITGNGPTGGTVTNWAINSTSTAKSQVTGGFDSTPIGANTPSSGAFTTLTSSSGIPASSLVAAAHSQKNVAGPITQTTVKMAGLAGSITPTYTGTVLLIISGDAKNATAIADGVVVQASYGTGTAPTSSSAVTGTQCGGTQKYVAATTAEVAPFSVNCLITGLSLATAYWLDLTLAQITGGTASISDISISAVEIR